MNSQTEDDRRRHERIRMNRPCKIYDPKRRKYLPAVTCDFSVGGMKMQLAGPVEFRPGDSLYLAIAQKRRQVLLKSEEMLRVRVLRSAIGPDDHTHLVVEFPHEFATSPARLRRAA